MPENETPIRDSSGVQLRLVLAIVGAAFIIGGSITGVKLEMSKLNDRMAIMESHIRNDWSTHDMQVWITFFRALNPTNNLQIPGVDTVKTYQPQ